MRLKSRELTDEVLRMLLTEEVHHHMCDSGGIYGYRHDIRAKIDLANEPEINYKIHMPFAGFVPPETEGDVVHEAASDNPLWVDPEYVELMRSPDVATGEPITTEEVQYSIPLYRYLKHTFGENLVTDAINAEIEKHLDEYYDAYDYVAMKAVATVSNRHTHDSEFELRDNTTNEVNSTLSNVSDVFIYSVFIPGVPPTQRAMGRAFERGEDDVYMIIMIHGGCDVRSGYGRPYAVVLKSDEYYGLPQPEVIVRWDEWCGVECASTRYDGHQIRDEGSDEFLTIIDWEDGLGYIPIMPEKVPLQVDISYNN